MHKLKNAQAVAALLTVFVLGGMAVSGAQRTPPPVETSSALDWRQSAPAGDWSLHGYTLRVGLGTEAGDLTVFLARAAHASATLVKPLSGTGPAALSGNRIARKVSLHLLDSVLLI